MTTLTGFVASVVVHSSAAAFAHFGLSMEPLHVEKAAPPPAERVVARSRPAPQKLVDCPVRRVHPQVDKV
ncbi:MAG TPA: hypothetical protein VHV27_03680 [Phenylobacterium sp.]|jgi:hypothetical protein|nr:hypothetical protein [Phenylobacterium sp.]